MAVQIPDPGTGNGQTGDNEYVFRKKVKDNFSDQTNAASRLVGPEKGQIPLSDDVAALSVSSPPAYISVPQAPNYDLNTIELGRVWIGSAAANFPSQFANAYVATHNSYTAGARRQIAYEYTGSRIATRSIVANGSVWTQWSYIYSTTNTTKDANGFIKAASPIVKVCADKVVLNEEAEQQNVTYKKNGVGDYTITTQSGLSTDGWYIELPKDMNGNPKVAVTLSEVDGVISLKSYKRIFSMETFTFEPDLDNPLDIPDTRWIDLRLNEIPVEMPDDTQMEV